MLLLLEGEELGVPLVDLDKVGVLIHEVQDRLVLLSIGLVESVKGDLRQAQELLEHVLLAIQPRELGFGCKNGAIVTVFRLFVALAILSSCVGLDAEWWSLALGTLLASLTIISTCALFCPRSFFNVVNLGHLVHLLDALDTGRCLPPRILSYGVLPDDLGVARRSPLLLEASRDGLEQRLGVLVLETTRFVLVAQCVAEGQ